MRSKQYQKEHVLSIVLILLTASAVLSIIGGQSVYALEDHEITTVVILPATGGSIDPPFGNHSYANNTALTVTATANAGYQFLYWNVTGIMNTEGEHDSMETDTSDMGHGGPFAGISEEDSLILTDRSITINVDCAYTYTYQAFFTPSENSSPAPTATSTTSTKQQTGDTNNLLTYLAIGIIGTIVPVSAAAGIYVKRKRKTPLIQNNP